MIDWLADLFYVEPCLRPIIAWLLILLALLAVTFLYAAWRRDK
jgi:hypothetical protein